MLALDEDEGSLRWRYEPAGSSGLSIEGSGDGALVAVWSTHQIVDPPRFTGLLDAITGTLLAEGPAAIVDIGGSATRWRWSGRNPMPPAQWPTAAGRRSLPAFACGGPPSDNRTPTFTTRRTYLALCADDARTASVVAQDLADGSIVAAPGAVVAVVRRCAGDEGPCRAFLLGFPH